MEPNRNDSSKNNNPDSKKPRNRVLPMLLIAIALVLVVTSIYNSVKASKYELKTYSEFLTEMQADNLAEVELHTDRIFYLTKTEAEKPAEERRACYTGLPAGDHMALLEQLHAMGVQGSEKIVEDNSLIMMIFSYALMIGGLMLVMSLITRRMGAAGGMGDNKAKVVYRLQLLQLQFYQKQKKLKLKLDLKIYELM